MTPGDANFAFVTFTTRDSWNVDNVFSFLKFSKYISVVHKL